MRWWPVPLALLLLAASPTSPRAQAGAGRTPVLGTGRDALLDDPDSGAELIGRPARALTFDRWARGGPLDLKSLRGHVVLMRWWTDGCPYCRGSLPALEALRARYAKDGLIVIGVYHPKPPGPRSDADIVAAAERLGFHGPIAVDERWSTLERWWLAGHPDRSFTSVSFLIGRDGRVRWVHRGGELHPGEPGEACDLSWRDLERALPKVLGRS
ncbi:MAG TPA: redoxin domain-containing protein [Candidatus Eisenbacteria bacterium]|nr:redoxin domain-containing protein [Candidatus Eisenbacteria bacterium]